MLFIRKTFPRFNFIQYGRHAFSYVLLQVTVNIPLVRVKFLRVINQNPDSYSYLYSCLCECSLTVAVSQRPDRQLNPRPLDCKSNVLMVMPPRHHGSSGGGSDSSSQRKQNSHESWFRRYSRQRLGCSRLNAVTALASGQTDADDHLAGAG